MCALYKGDKLIAGVAIPVDGARSIGQIVQSAIPLSDAGLHPLDGIEIEGSGIYEAFVNYVKSLYEGGSATNCFAQSTIKVVYNYVEEGTLTDNNGILSGFSASNYAIAGSTSNIFSPNTSSWEINLKMLTGSNVSTAQYLIVGNGTVIGFGGIGISNSKFILNLSSNDSSADIASGVTGNYTVLANTNYWIKLSFNGVDTYSLSYSTDGETFISDISVTSSTSVFQGSYILLGINRTNQTLQNPFLGSIDLSESYIKINSAIWWQGKENVVISADQVWQNYVAEYGVCGKFVYTAASGSNPAKVRIPLYNNKIYTSSINPTTPVKGNDISIGLTNGTDSFGLSEKFGSNGFGKVAIGSAVGTSGATQTIIDKAVGLTTEGTKSGIIADLADITTPLDGYYYIVVSTSTKTDIEVDIDEVATDLNNKVDKSSLVEVPVIVESFYDKGSWYKVYSPDSTGYKWCEQGGIGAEGATITFLKEFAFINYSIILTDASMENYGIGVSSKTTTSFVFGIGGNTTGGGSAYWRASGYIL